MQFDSGSNCASNFKIEELVLLFKSCVRKFQTNLLNHPWPVWKFKIRDERPALRFLVPIETHCDRGSKVSCPRTQHNVPNSARTQTARPGDERTNQRLQRTTLKVYMTDYFFYLLDKISTKKTDKNSTKKISIVILWLPLVLIYQKRQIALPRDQKQETRNDCEAI